MQISNAQRWLELCEKQAQLIDNLSQTFPERNEQHEHLSGCWRQVAEYLSHGEFESMTKLK
ncbi:hypothetical protein L2719_01560 [Shewanella schlegeliana]|uniref:Uncharacterized protein n=1 Tax=Shewanella schlegeliana TaxID=190308 RepID=A0ABS1SVB9_9GAMM|nr:hypothetical protein [Shewanella schlegeliana]MBL4912280.1 hypothetical protein [Shewanella schlegeliana]MCL1108251.1 hypothetical protein [Shewanella schlegeliana]GIU22353.1 hypothetical protein TUM4433_03100 [Shewanella schlegeliana]